MMQIIFWVVVAIVGIGLILLGNRLVKNAPRHEEHTMCYGCPYEDKDDLVACVWLNWCIKHKGEAK